MREDDLAPLKARVFQSIGRNIVLLQQIEAQLRWLVTNAKLSGSASQLDAQQRKRVKRFAKQGVGSLSLEYGESVLKRPPSPQTEAGEGTFEEVSEVHLSMCFHLDNDEEGVRTRRFQLRQLVNQRNELVHKLLPRWDPTSRESCDALAAWLDEQHRHAVGEFLTLQAECQGVIAAIQATAEFFASEEGKRLFNAES